MAGYIPFTHLIYLVKLSSYKKWKKKAKKLEESSGHVLAAGRCQTTTRLPGKMATIKFNQFCCVFPPQKIRWGISLMFRAVTR